jgi:hypothetical protein
MALKAVETLLLPFGDDVGKLREVFGCSLQKKKRQAASGSAGQGSLFDP